MKLSLAMVFLVCFAGAAHADGSAVISVTPTADGKSTQLTPAAGASLVGPLLEVKAIAVLRSPKGADGRWHHTKSVLYPSDLPGRMENPLELKATQAAIEKRVKAGVCHELPGLDQRSAP